LEQLNIEGKRSGEGFICHKERLIGALARAQAPKVEVIDTTLGRKGFLSYLRALGGSNIVKIIPSNSSASEAQTAAKGLKVVCGANLGYLVDEAWITEKIKFGDFCQIRVSPQNTVKPNLGGSELAEALARVIPFAAKEKDRPILACVRFAQKEGKLTLTASDGFRLAEVTLDFEEGDGEALVEAIDLRGLIPALKKARRAKVGFVTNGEKLGSKSLVIDTELIRYKWNSLDGTYPDYEKVIPTEFIAEARFDTREALKVVNSLGALFLDRGSEITLSIKEGRVMLSAKEDRGEAQIEAQAEGEAETSASGAYLAQTLKAFGGMVELKVASPQSPLMFSDDGYRVAVMPILKPESKAVAEAQEVATKAEAKGKRKARKGKAKAETIADGEAADLPPEAEAVAEAEPVAV
jgi:DNA polymerase III sliding clamp (beta) subunit (PCNA family)